jgi:serine/threonine-protein kinase RsbW
VSALLHLRLDAEPESVPLARAAITGVCSQLGLAADITERIRLAVTEACTNVVRHAYVDQRGNTYSLEATVDRGALLVVVRDAGVGITAPADAAQAPSLGLWMQMIARLAMSTDIAALPGYGTRVAMRFDMT